MKLSHISLILVIILSTALSACATVQLGRQFDLNAFATRVERGVTTQAQVQQWLGPPKGTGTAVSTSGETYEEWTYFYGYGKIGNMSHAETKILQIKFDRQGIVRGYNYSVQAKKNKD
jgi:outer membrane protein assembly factor BamE (lipoprotein component of BamABCDE complex)